MIKYVALRTKIQHEISSVLLNYESYKDIGGNIFHYNKSDEKTINKIWTTVFDKKIMFDLSTVFAISNIPTEMIFCEFNKYEYIEKQAITSIIFVPNNICGFIANNDNDIDLWLNLLKIQINNNIDIYEKFKSIIFLENHINYEFKNKKIQDFDLINDISAEKGLILSKLVSDDEYYKMKDKIILICDYLNNISNSENYKEYANTKLKNLDTFLSKYTAEQLNNVNYLKQLFK